MPRTFGGTISANLALQFPTPAFTLDIILADGTTRKRLTTHPFELTVDGNVYNSSGLTLSKIRFGVDKDRASSEAQISTRTESPVSIADVDAGVYRSSTYEIGITNYAAASPVRTVLLAGIVGRPSWDDKELSVTFELKGLLRTGQRIIVWKNTPNCKCTLGDDDCRLPVIEDASVSHITLRADSTAYVDAEDTTEGQADYIRVLQASSFNNRIFECTTSGTSAGTPPTFDLTVGNTTTDGTAVWTARESWVREATVATVIDLQRFTVTVTEPRAVDGWFGGFGNGFGLAIFRDNENINRQMEIIKWTNTTAEVQLAAPLPFAVQVGDELDLIPADPKTFEYCWDTFGHGEWFCGEPYKGPVDIFDTPV